jgi:hypothetical protein
MEKRRAIVPSQKGASLVLISSKVSDAGNYTAEASNGAGTTTSVVMKLIVDPPVKPVVYQSPFDQVVEVGQSFSFSAYVSEGKIQWRKNGVPLAGATNATFSVASATAADAGTYDFVVTQDTESTLSAAGAVTINAEAKPPGSNAAPVLRKSMSSRMAFLGASGRHWCRK